MSNLLETALRLLSRPTEGKPLDPAKRRKSEAIAADTPLTQEELRSALTQLAADRETASAMLAGAADQREGLLMQPGSDTAIFQLAQDIDSAQLTLERLDRLEPDLRVKLSRVELRDSNLAWIADRDAASPALAEFAAAIDAYASAYDKWGQVLTRITDRWPKAKETVPKMPSFAVSSSDTYAEQLAKFALIELIPAPWVRPLMVSLAQAIAHTRTHGAPPADIPSDWVEPCMMAIDPDGVQITITVNTLDSEGQPLSKGHVLRVPFEEGERLTRSGRAFYS